MTEPAEHPLVSAVKPLVDALLRRSLEAGATRVSLQVNVIGEGEQ